MSKMRGWLIGLTVLVGLWVAFALSIRFLIPGPPDVPPDAFELPSPWLLLMFLGAALYTVGYAIAAVIGLGVLAFDQSANRRARNSN